MRIRPVLWGPGVMILVGLIFAIVGLFLALGASAGERREAARAERLLPLGAVAFDETAPGREVLVEGRVSDRNRAQFRGYKAYIREEYRGSDDENRPKWVEDERITPPLLLAVDDGLITLNNQDYRPEAWPQVWQESESLSWNGFSGEGTKRYRGLNAGDTVTAIGAVTRGPEGPALQAEVVFSGDRAAYIAAQHDAATVSFWMGTAFAAFGALFALFGAWSIVRALRR